jgi:protease-4
MAADRIFASQYTITGSIGIYVMFPTYQRSLDAIGITTDGVGSTFWAGELRPDREMTDETRTMLQLVTDKGYDDFISKVAMHRGIDKDDVDTIAQGQVWTGREAVEHGLIDEIGELDAAIETAAELAGLEPDGYGMKYFEKELSPGERLALDLMGGVKWLGFNLEGFAAKRSSIERMANVLEDAISPIMRLNDPKGLYAHCFCAFE